MQLNTTILKLIEIINNDDNYLYNNYVKDNFIAVKEIYPFLIESDYAEKALKKIMVHSNNPNLYIEVINQLDDKYIKRNFALMLCEFYQGQNNLEGLTEAIALQEFDFLGFRELVVYFANNYSEKDFLNAFAKINRRESLMPRDYNAIKLFVEKFSFNNGIEEAKKMCTKLNITKLVNHTIPMILGQASTLTLPELESLIKNEVEDMDTEVRVHEEVFTKLYERNTDNSLQIKILDSMASYAELIPKDLKVRGYPSKFWTLYSWRIGMKYLELDQKEKVEEIIKKLDGKHKKLLKDSFIAKYKN